ncbi:hypothetical protein F1880_009156 [Penicillium rolfsii]|nr:hypothetical protein F1880_009156 [Penicillium rolfsii]
MADERETPEAIIYASTTNPLRPILDPANGDPLVERRSEQSPLLCIIKESDAIPRQQATTAFERILHRFGLRLRLRSGTIAAAEKQELPFEIHRVRWDAIIRRSWQANECIPRTCTLLEDLKSTWFTIDYACAPVRARLSRLHGLCEASTQCNRSLFADRDQQDTSVAGEHGQWHAGASSLTPIPQQGRD